MDLVFSWKFNQMMQGACQPKTKVGLKFDFAFKTKPLDDSVHQSQVDKFPSKLSDKAHFFNSTQFHRGAREQPCSTGNRDTKKG